VGKKRAGEGAETPSPERVQVGTVKVVLRVPIYEGEDPEQVKRRAERRVRK
jgi:hypothetical protein